MEKINWGIIGLGNIAQTFSEGFLNIKNARLLAISSSNASKLEYFKNKYEINGDMPLRHSQESHRTIKELLDWVEHTTEDTLDEYNVLENWTVGEHGSEV